MAVTARHYIIIAAMGAVASVLGILGDLFASAVKRQVGIKDYGTIFPGHGGILDRFDSVMFIAPLVSIVVRYFFYVFQYSVNRGAAVSTGRVPITRTTTGTALLGQCLSIRGCQHAKNHYSAWLYRFHRYSEP